jgi:hypothetical protein
MDPGALCLCSFVVIGIQWLTTRPQGHKEISASNNPFEPYPRNLAKSLFLAGKDRFLIQLLAAFLVL